MVKRGAWRTRFGFYLVAIGSACGLGNLWRFPYVVGENGGGAFILLYVLIALAIGAPILIAELILGKNSRKSILKVGLNLKPKLGWWPPWVSVAAMSVSLVVLAYYSVISGWVLHFLTQFVVGALQRSVQEPALNVLMDNGWLQFMLASAHLLLALVVVAKGVQEGLEKWISYVMPLFAFLVVLLVFQSLSLSSSTGALRFLFYPDFSKLNWSSLNHALGHVFFTLSVGFGTMVTFGSYMRDEDHIPTAGFRVALVDTLISLVAVVMIFPIAFEASNVPLTDPALLFDVLPGFLLSQKAGLLFGLAFFLCLYLASLNASIGLLEVIVSNLVDRFPKLQRRQATWLSGAMALVLAIFPALSSTVFGEVRPGGKSLIEGLDSLMINWILPLTALGISLMFSRGLSQQDKAAAFVNKDRFVSHTMYPHWLFSLHWLTPALIALGFLMQIWSGFAN